MHRAQYRPNRVRMEAGHRAAVSEARRKNMNGADFALHIMNAPAVVARPGSIDELAALGLDRHLRLAESTKYQGEAGLCDWKNEKYA